MKLAIYSSLLFLFGEILPATAQTGIHDLAKPTERFTSVGTCQFFIADTGKGSPCVILVSDMLTDHTTFSSLQKKIAAFTRVISYDRSGIGKSPACINYFSYTEMATQIRGLLRKEKIAPPYILVGHCMGGQIVRMYADLFPGDVAGLVLIDSPSDMWFNYLEKTMSPERWKKCEAAWKKFDYYSSIPTSGETMANFRLYCMEMSKITFQPGIPVRVITSLQYGEDQKSTGIRPDDMSMWAQLQREMIFGVKNAKQVIAHKSDHLIYQSEPELVITAIKEISNLHKK